MEESGNSADNNQPVFKAPVVLSLNTRKIQSQNVLEADPTAPKDSKPKLSAAQLKQTPLADPNVAEGDEELKLIAEALDRGKKQTGPETVSLGPSELRYEVPNWSGMPAEGYSLEILKNGVVIDNYDLTVKPFYLVGRLEQADLHLDHPSVSRCHAIIQYRAKSNEKSPPGFYIYDLESTHGTFLNKQPLRPRQYVRLHVGHVIKFGGSTRLFILEGPEADAEEESQLTVTQLKERARKQKEIMEGRVKRLEEKEQNEPETSADTKPEEPDEGINWGMNEDAQDEEKSDEEEEEEIDLRKPMKLSFTIEQRREREKLYIDDPRKALRHFFEREGYEMEFVFTEKNIARGAQWNCRIELPVEDEKGMPLWAEATVSGSKKDAMHQCALEACRKLDEFDYLRKKAVTKKRKSRDWESNDYYDSDEDDYLDRTGQLEKKRKARMKKDGKAAVEKADTFQTLVEKLEKVKAEISVFEKELAELEKVPKSEVVEIEEKELDEDSDALDNYMTSLANGKDKPTLASTISIKAKKNHIRLHLADLNHQATRLRQLAHIAKPAILPDLKKPEDKKKFPLVGSMKGGLKYKRLTEAKVIIKPPPIMAIPTGNEIEVEEDEEEEKSKAEDVPVVKVLEEKDEKIISPTKAADSSEPSTSDLQNDDREEMTEEKSQPTVKKPRHRGKGPKQQPKPANYDLTDDPSYAVWMPPENQSGDGKTNLNAKFGY